MTAPVRLSGREASRESGLGQAVGSSGEPAPPFPLSCGLLWPEAGLAPGPAPAALAFHWSLNLFSCSWATTAGELVRTSPCRADGRQRAWGACGCRGRRWQLAGPGRLRESGWWADISGPCDLHLLASRWIRGPGHSWPALTWASAAPMHPSARPRPVAEATHPLACLLPPQAQNLGARPGPRWPCVPACSTEPARWVFMQPPHIVPAGSGAPRQRG